MCSDGRRETSGNSLCFAVTVHDEAFLCTDNETVGLGWVKRERERGERGEREESVCDREEIVKMKECE